MVRQFYVITFGGPSRNYYDAVDRVCCQARAFEMFDKVIGYTDRDLKDDKIFWNDHKDFIENNARGYGYWIWKPYLILKILNELNDNDLLLYVDCGCELNIKGKDKMVEFINKVDEKLIIGTRANSDDTNFTKKDTIIYFNMENSDKLATQHMQPGCVLMKKCETIVNLYSKFYDACRNYHLIDDSPSIEPNFDNFIEHRHDQSIFNMLVKKLNLHNYDFEHLTSDYPVLPIRNKSGISTLN